MEVPTEEFYEESTNNNRRTNAMPPLAANCSARQGIFAVPDGYAISTAHNAEVFYWRHVSAEETERNERCEAPHRSLPIIPAVTHALPDQGLQCLLLDWPAPVRHLHTNDRLHCKTQRKGPSLFLQYK